jgi:hypothetical protein
MSEVDEEFKRLILLESLTGKPVPLGELPDGFWVIEDKSETIPTVTVLLDRFDQRIKSTKEMIKLYPNWLEIGLNHGENARGAFRLLTLSAERKIAPIPKMEYLIELTEKKHNVLIEKQDNLPTFILDPEPF